MLLFKDLCTTSKFAKNVINSLVCYRSVIYASRGIFAKPAINSMIHYCSETYALWINAALNATFNSLNVLPGIHLSR